MSDDERRKIRVSKLEAARRQLDCAIELWFTDKDEVSIHTLSAAAYQIVQDVNRHRKTEFETIYDTVVIRDEHRDQWRALIRQPINFFKHADKDAEADVEFAPAGSLMLLVYIIHGLGYLQSPSSSYERLLFIWLLIHKPTFIKDETRERLAKDVGVEHLRTLSRLSKPEFFKTMSEAIVALK